MSPNPALAPKARLGALVVFGFYAFLCVAGLAIFTAVFSVFGYLPAAVAGTTGAAFVANWVSLRVFERGRFLDAGLWWTRHSLRNVGLGLAMGVGPALLVTLVPLALGFAELVPEPENPGSFGQFSYVTGLLIFGAVAEELMFRGYAFQVLARGFGAWATLIVTSLLFGLVHTGNLGFNGIALANTLGFGVVLGYAMLRSGALWLPIGLHFGWNWVPPLIGVNLSGFNMRVTGYSLHWKTSEFWSGGAYGPEGSVLTCGVVAGLLLLLWKMPVPKEEPPPRPVTSGEGPPSEA